MNRTLFYVFRQLVQVSCHDLTFYYSCFVNKSLIAPRDERKPVAS